MDWNEAKPVLKATYELLEAGEDVTQDEVCAAVGRPPQDERTVRALALLYEGGYIGGFTVNQSPAPVRIQGTPKGLQETSGWPREGGAGAEQIELLLRLLDERIASDETPEEEKGKLLRARDAFAALGRDVAVGVLTAYAGKVSGASD
jgi:hypothetical protein